MREILFRGKRIDNGEWVKGSLVCFNAFERAAIMPSDSTAYKKATEPVLFSKRCFDVGPSTVSQYTGLKDKNGRKIFEGDILDCGDRIVFVQWHEQCGTWDSQLMRYQNEPSSNGVNNVEWKFRAVVIGNLHDKEVLT